VALIEVAVPTPIWLEDRVELSLPADAELFFLARITAAAIGAQAGFGQEQIDDLRLVADELVVELLRGPQPDVMVRLTFEWSRGIVEIVATLGPSLVPASSAEKSERDLPTTCPRRLAEPGRVTDGEMAEELKRCVLDALVDLHGCDTAGPTPVSWVRVSVRPAYPAE
jgi:hypothetical protein